MTNYNTKSEKTKSLDKLAENTTKAVDYLFGLLKCKFVVLNVKGLPIKAYKDAERITQAETLDAINKTGHIGLVPKSIGMWVFVKTNPNCKFKVADSISYRDSNKWLQYWYAGNIYKSLNPYRCNADLDDMFGYCGRIIQQHEYIILKPIDLINLAAKLFNIDIFDSNSELRDPESNPEISPYFLKIPKDHIVARTRLYKDVPESDMPKVIKKAHGYNIFPITKALILEIAIRNHVQIKAGEIKSSELYNILVKWSDGVSKTIRLKPSALDKLAANAYNFAKNKYLVKRDYPEHHMGWIRLYTECGMSITEIHRTTGYSYCAISTALIKYGVHKPHRRVRNK